MAWFSGSSAAKAAEKLPELPPMKDSKVDLVKEQGMVLASNKLTKSVLRDLHVKSGKMKSLGSKGGGKKGSPAIFQGNMTFPFAVQAGGGGVFGVLIGGTLMLSSADFGSFTTLFDIVRITGITLMYQPNASGAQPNTGVVATVGNHVPFIAVYDPELSGTAPITYVGAATTRDWTDRKTNVMSNTSRSLDRTWHTPVGRKVVAELTGATVPTLGDWTDTGILTAPGIAGGVSFSTVTQASNASIVFGQAIVTYHAQWSYRL